MCIHAFHYLHSHTQGYLAHCIAQLHLVSFALYSPQESTPEPNMTSTQITKLMDYPHQDAASNYPFFHARENAEVDFFSTLAKNAAFMSEERVHPSHLEGRRNPTRSL